MSVAELLYLDDAYRREFDAVVTAVDQEANALALDRTLFFPTGGGQPHDTGELTLEERSVAITNVAKDKDGAVWHTLGVDAPLPAVGAPVSGAIDWGRRYLTMRVHTAQNAVTPVILGLISLGPRSGYEIKATVDRSTRFFWAASYGQIYPELRRLERDGLIEGEDAPNGARPRRVYRLTQAGRDEL